MRGGEGDDDHGDSNGCPLPEDQVFEMLTRVPLGDLAACRGVSSQWRRLTYEQGFARLHCRRANAVSGYIVQSMLWGHFSTDFVSPEKEKGKEISLGFLPFANVCVVAVAAHRGLVCCEDGGRRQQKHRYYVCKPATRQWRALPPTPLGRTVFPKAATAIAARPSGAAEFKVVRICGVTGRWDYLRCFVFDSRRFAWRRCADVPLHPGSLDTTRPAVCAHGGAMHWLRWVDIRSKSVQDVFAFDMRSETWRLIPLPPVEDRSASKMIVAVEDRLRLLVRTRDVVVEVWEMASYARGTWARKTPVSLKSLYAQEGRGTILGDLSSSNVAFVHGFYRAMWYDFSKGKMAQVRLNHRGVIEEVFKFESDFSYLHQFESDSSTPRKKASTENETSDDYLGLSDLLGF